MELYFCPQWYHVKFISNFITNTGQCGITTVYMITVFTRVIVVVGMINSFQISLFSFGLSIIYLITFN